MSTYKDEVWLPRSLEEVFGFFSDACNLQTITPEWLNFSILSPCPIEMRSGTMIDYRLKIRGIPVRWRSEITAWEPPWRFVDEQRRGPYRRWVHEHRFTLSNGGTVVMDKVSYSVFGGALVDRLFVRKDVESIFRFRREKLLELFAK